MSVRDTNWAGPCIELGEFVRRTPKFIVFVDRRTGEERRMGGSRLKHDLIHTTPCLRCMDHPNTYYPNGYEG